MQTGPSHRPSGRERILDQASILFYAEGIHAVGVDRIVAAAGVTKATLYQQFRSKDELVAAYLTRRSDYWQETIAEPACAVGGPTDRRVAGVFSLLAKAVSVPGFRGCPFINAAAEYPDADSPVATVIASHRGRVRNLFVDLLADRPAVRRHQLADQLVVLYDGTMVGAQLDPSARTAQRAQTAVAALLTTPRP
jgi:AcrR family transcriptional regulator